MFLFFSVYGEDPKPVIKKKTGEMSYMQSPEENRRLQPEKYAKVIREISEILKKRNSFLVCGHIRPDGDCIGSQMALYFALKDMGKEVRLFNAGPIQEQFSFVPEIGCIETTLDYSYKPDVCIYVDCGSRERVIDKTPPSDILVNIDHHPSNGSFGDVNYIDPGATAVGEQLYHIFREMQVPLTPEIAMCLYLSVLTDSGSFRFSNTSAVTFAVASAAVQAGADPAAIAQAFYENKTPESVYLSSLVLENLHYECDGAFVWSEITWDMYESAGGEKNEPEGLVGEMRGIKGVEISILFHELPEGGMRAGLRSKGKIDVSRIAREMGGGGHVNASGCYIEGDYESLKNKLISSARKNVEEQLKVEAGRS